MGPRLASRKSVTIAEYHQHVVANAMTDPRSNNPEDDAEMEPDVLVVGTGLRSQGRERHACAGQQECLQPNAPAQTCMSVQPPRSVGSMTSNVHLPMRGTAPPSGAMPKRWPGRRSPQRTRNQPLYPPPHGRAEAPYHGNDARVRQLSECRLQRRLTATQSVPPKANSPCNIPVNSPALCKRAVIDSLPWLSTRVQSRGRCLLRSTTRL